jgi:hypothetical protein
MFPRRRKLEYDHCRLLTSPHHFQTGLFSSTVATFIAISYPSLQQDPNVVTQSLLAQISQQLSSANANGSIPTASPSTQIPFTPSASVVFVNSVWFLSLVLSLTCALMATLMQQWARRYLQIVQRNYAPHIRAHIREYFSRGARKFCIFGLVELLPSLLLISVLLFFAGLVVFAFLANHMVAYITLAIVGFCFLSYNALTFVPLVYRDCPYYTPLTSVLWCSAQIIGLFFSSVLHYGAKQLHKRWGAVSARAVNSFRHQQESKSNSWSWSEDVISKLAKSATEVISMDIHKNALTWTIHQLDQDHELEEFIAGIPGLYEFEAFVTPDNSVQSNIRHVLAVLPGPTSSDASLPWSIIRLAQRAISGNLSKPIQLKRTQTCLKALYCIPGAIRDLLASYAAGKHYCLEILPLLNSPESLEIINELWDTPNDDIALSVRCAAAVVASFMITPPRRLLDLFLPPDVRFIGEDFMGEQFLAKRLRDGASASVSYFPNYHLHSDNARLRNIVCFLEDIRGFIQFLNAQLRTFGDVHLIHQQRRALSDARHTNEYRVGRSTFDQQGDRASPAFVHAAQQDLITLTLEILARDPVATAAVAQREAFSDVFRRLGMTPPWPQARRSARMWRPANTQSHVLSVSQNVLDTLVSWGESVLPATDIIEIFSRALDPVLASLSRSQNATPHADHATPPSMSVLQVVSTPRGDGQD